MRKNIVAGNWKMNNSLEEGLALSQQVSKLVDEVAPQNVTVVLGTPFIHLSEVAKTKSANVDIAAQNCADKESGAYTGEVSAAMVASTGAKYVILGHSERREYYGETSTILNDKVKLALANGLEVIYCCGEPLEIREAGTQNDFVGKQLDETIFQLSGDDFAKITIAYEPIWAIGTGKTASTEQAQDMHAYIRSLIVKKFGEEVAEDTSIIYGGSCKPSNAPELFSQKDIDGGLIGGASLKADDFMGIVTAF